MRRSAGAAPSSPTSSRTPARPSAAIGGEGAALDQALRFLPDTLRKGNTTFVNLRATLDDLDVLVDESKPATKDLAPLFRELRPLVATPARRPRPLKLVRTAGASNDLTDLLRTAPGSRSVERAGARARREALREAAPLPLQPALRPRADRLAARLRPQRRPTTTPTATTPASRRSSSRSSSPTRPRAASCPLPPEQSTTGCRSGNERRCPGAATQPRATGRRRWRTRTARTTATPARCRPAHDARARHRRVVISAVVLAVLAPAPPATMTAPTACARSS